MKISIITAISLFFLYQPAVADDVTDVTRSAKDTIDVVIQLIKNKKIDKKTKKDEIIGAVAPIFDFRQMAKLSLKKQYRKQLKKEKKLDEYIDSFVNKLQKFYLSKLDLFSDEKLIVENARPILYKSGKKKGKPYKNRLQVPTYFVSEDAKVELIYLFYKSKKTKQWKVYDAIIENSSIAKSRSAQNTARWKKAGSVDAFLDMLKVDIETEASPIKK